MGVVFLIRFRVAAPFIFSGDITLPDKKSGNMSDGISLQENSLRLVSEGISLQEITLGLVSESISLRGIILGLVSEGISLKGITLRLVSEYISLRGKDPGLVSEYVSPRENALRYISRETTLQNYILQHEVYVRHLKWMFTKKKTLANMKETKKGVAVSQRLSPE